MAKDKNDTAVDPWALQDAVNDQMETGAPFEWKFGWTFWIRPINEWNAHYVSALRRAAMRKDVKKHLEALQEDDTLLQDPDYIAQSRKFDMQAFALGCLVDWQGVTARGGAVLKHSQANACTLLEHFPDLFDAMKDFSTTPSNYDTTDDPAEADQSEN